MSSFVLRIAASPSRTTRWSSAMSTLIFSMGCRLLFHQRNVDDNRRATPLLGLDLPFAAHEPSPLEDSANPEMIPFIGISQHGVHVESHTVVSNGDPQALGVDIKHHGHPRRFRMPLHIAESFLHDPEQEDLGARE